MKKYTVQDMVLVRSIIKPNYTWKIIPGLYDRIGYFYGGLCGAL